MTGVIGLAVNDNARYTDFYAAKDTLLPLPDGWKFSYAQGSDRIIQRNRIVRGALARGDEWVAFLDDDSVFGPNLINRLLSHNKPIVGGLYMQRVYPHSPVAYEAKINGKYMPVDLNEHPGETGLIEVVACGTGGILIHTDVFKSMEEPWFDYGVHSEDMIFCDTVRDLGWKVYVDLHPDAAIGHICTSKVWPVSTPNGWNLGITVSDRLNLQCPIGTDEVTGSA